VPDAFHSGSRLEKIPEVVVASEPSGEELTLDQAVRHAPRDIDRKGDGLIHVSGGQLLNEVNDVRDRGRNLVDTWAVVTAWISTWFLITDVGRKETDLDWGRSRSCEDREGRSL